MAGTASTSYIAIASSLSTVAVFAGGFTLNSLLTVESPQSPTLLSVSFTLFSFSLFVGIWVQVSLRRGVINGGGHRGLVEFLLSVMGIVIMAGFIILNVIVLRDSSGSGLKVAGGFGIALTGAIAIVICVDLWNRRT
jgi:hypothetical protein